MRIWGLLAAITALALTGCTTSGSEDASPPSGNNADKSSPAAKAKPKPKADGPLKFGQAYTWKKGLTVTVRKPIPFKPSQYAALGKGPNHVALSVTLVNKTGKPFDPSLLNASAQSGDVEAEPDIDPDRGVGNRPQTKILDGRQATFKVGFAVKNPKDIVLEFEPDAGLTYKAALWQTRS